MSAGRRAVAALVALAVGVTVGAVLFGAPPRFEPAESASPGVALFLESLTPVLLVHLSVAVACGLLVASGPAAVLASRAALPLRLLLAFALLSLVPLPPVVHELISPFTAETYATLAADWPDRWRPFTLWPAGTGRVVLLLLGMLAATAAVRVAVRERGERVVVVLLAGIATLATLECLYGLGETWLGDDTILGFSKVSSRGAVTGTFIHRTMFAVWAGMGATAATALGVRAWTGETRRTGLAAVCAVVVGVALVAAQQSNSRLGFAAALAGVFVAFAALAWVSRAAGRAGPSRVALALGLLVPVAGLGGALLDAEFAQRMGYFVGYVQERPGPVEPRLATWAATWDLFGGAPVLGTGPGAFARAVHLTQTVDSPEEAWFAHSDPLNVLSDMGIVGFALAVWWVAASLRSVGGVLRAGGTRAVLCCGAVGGAAVALVASLADFQTQFPVVAIPFAALLAVPGALATDLDGDRSAVSPSWMALGIATIVVIAVFPVRGWWDRYSTLSDGGPHGATAAERDLRRGRKLLEQAATADDPRAEVTRAVQALERATLADPLLDHAHFHLAVARLVAGEGPEAALRSWGRARHVSRGHAELNLRIGDAYLRVLGTAPNPHGPAGDDALAALREAGALEPAMFSAAWQLAEEYRLSVESRKRLVPDRAHALRKLAGWLRREKKLPDEARRALERAVEVEPWDGRARIDLAQVLAEADEREAALLHFVRAVEVAGESEGVRRDAARGFVGLDAETDGRALFDDLGLTWPE